MHSAGIKKILTIVIRRQNREIDSPIYDKILRFLLSLLRNCNKKKPTSAENFFTQCCYPNVMLFVETDIFFNFNNGMPLVTLVGMT